MLVQEAANQVTRPFSQSVETYRAEMDRLASQLPEYPVVMRNVRRWRTPLGPQLMAEIGDVRRFERKQSLVAFARASTPCPTSPETKMSRSNKIL